MLSIFCFFLQSSYHTFFSFFLFFFRILKFHWDLYCYWTNKVHVSAQKKKSPKIGKWERVCNTLVISADIETRGSCLGFKVQGERSDYELIKEKKNRTQNVSSCSSVMMFRNYSLPRLVCVYWGSRHKRNKAAYIEIPLGFLEHVLFIIFKTQSNYCASLFPHAKLM